MPWLVTRGKGESKAPSWIDSRTSFILKQRCFVWDRVSDPVVPSKAQLQLCARIGARQRNLET